MLSLTEFCPICGCMKYNKWISYFSTQSLPHLLYQFLKMQRSGASKISSPIFCFFLFRQSFSFLCFPFLSLPLVPCHSQISCSRGGKFDAWSSRKSPRQCAFLCATAVTVPLKSRYTLLFPNLLHSLFLPLPSILFSFFDFLIPCPPPSLHPLHPSFPPSLLSFLPSSSSSITSNLSFLCSRLLNISSGFPSFSLSYLEHAQIVVRQPHSSPSSSFAQGGEEGGSERGLSPST